MKAYSFNDRFGPLPVSFEETRLCKVLRQARDRARKFNRVITVTVSYCHGPSGLHWTVYPNSQVRRHEQ